MKQRKIRINLAAQKKRKQANFQYCVDNRGIILQSKQTNKQQITNK